ncbi:MULTISPECIES: hypothetical protein [unclassified Frankia]|nr:MULTISPECIES: hypothetical protein [unclassified Frankia]
MSDASVMSSHEGVARNRRIAVEDAVVLCGANTDPTDLVASQGR